MSSSAVHPAPHPIARRFLAVATAVAVGFGGALVAVAAPAAADETVASATFSVSGVVTDQDGSPIRGAVVHADLPGTDQDPQGTTAADGTYTIANVTAGAILDATVPTDVPVQQRQYYTTQFWQAASTAATATPLPATDQTSVSAINFSLRRLPSISGVVVHHSGQPVPAVKYTIYTVVGGTATANDQGWTDSVGAFIEPVVAGTTTKILFEDELGAGAPDVSTVSRTNPLASEYFDNATSLASATPIIVNGASEQRYLGNLPLDPATGPTTMLDQPLAIVEKTGSPLTLGYTRGAFSPAGVTIATQWLRDGVAIDGATHASYEYTDADYGVGVAVRLTTTRPDGTVTTFTSPANTAWRSYTAVGTPSVSGTVAVGNTLTASPGTWDPQPGFAYRWLRAGTPIAGATDATYTLVTDDLGSAVQVELVASKPGFHAVTVTSPPTAPVASGTFAATLPTIAGDPVYGQVLTATSGEWTPAASHLEYQWLRAGSPIAGATAATYALGLDDIGANISVRVTATRDGYTPATRDSLRTASVQSATQTAGTPSVTGSAIFGQTLTAHPGDWGSADVTYGYQWLRDGVAIADATGPTYSLALADLTHAVSVRVTATRPGYAALAATSAQVGPVGTAELDSVEPTVSGTTTFGETLAASAGSWGPGSVALSYQWLRGGVPIAGATSAAYTLVVADVGTQITVAVTGREAGYTDETRTSESTAKVALATLATVEPTISGGATFGKTLGASHGTWNPTPTAWQYQWMRDGIPIDGETDIQHVVSVPDVGAVLTVEVTGLRAGYAPATVESAPTATVVRAAMATKAPKVVGDAVFGSELSVDPGAWTPVPSFTYEWQRDGIDIAGATDETYRLVADDIGTEISVVITGTKDGYIPQSRTSGPTEEIARAQFAVPSPPVITGLAVSGEYLEVATPAWSPQPDVLTLQWFRGASAIAGATGTRYRVTDADLSSAVSVRATGVKSGYATETSDSAPTAKVSAPRPFGTVPKPTISGTARVGASLTARPGTWVPAAATTSYQWRVAGSAVSGATDPTFVPRSSDLKKTISVTVTSTTPGYVTKASTSVTTKAVAAGTLSTVTPTITGTAQVGEKLTAAPGSWGPTGVALKYQWLRGSTAIRGATSADYTATATDYKQSLTVRVTGSKAGFTTVAKASRAVKVAAGVLAPDTAPVISGDSSVGAVLSTSAGSWLPSVVTRKYQWLAGGVAIAGATSAKLTVPASALGKVISVRVTATKTGYAADAALATGAVVTTGIFAATPTPTISGTPQVGKKLTAVPGTWVPRTSTTYSYQWFAVVNGGDPVAIARATASTYAPAAEYRDARVMVRVTGKRAGYTSVETQSTPSSVVLGTLVSPTPKVTGTAKVAKTLKVSVGTWTPGATLTIQWVRTKSGTVRSISKATATSYRVTSADKGWTISARVTGKLAGYGTAIVTSKATKKVS